MSAIELSTVAGLLAALSVTSERLVEIIKGAIPVLEQKNADAKKEGWRRSALHLLSLAAGIFSAFLAWGAVKGFLPGDWWQAHSTLGPIGVGFLAAGGSSFWNSILGYSNKLKDFKKAMTDKIQKEAAG